MELFDYQEPLKTKTIGYWNNGVKYVLVVLPTGGGKTVVLSHIVKTYNVRTVCMAHRAELVGQMATTLGANGVYHNIIAPRKTVKMIVRRQIKKLGQSFYDPSAPITVASVDTINSRDLGPWAESVGLWVMDEAHHLLKANKFGKAVDKFPNAVGLGVTATPCRADGKGLGLHNDGYFEVIAEGPTMRDLIHRGRLCDYKVYVPTSEGFNRDTIELAADGDYKKASMSKAVQGSKIIGDAVKSYQKYANGKRTIVFAPDIDTASQLNQNFINAGVPAEIVTGKTKPDIREAALERFESGETLVLVNVDLFGEGFDVPSVVCVIMCRPTKSYALHSQQFGRALRVLEGKPYAIIIDHVGNITDPQLGLPDAQRIWSLERKQKRPRKKADDAVPLTVCSNPECFRPYLKTNTECPYCGHKHEPQGRESPEQVDGDVAELSAEVLEKMRAEAARIVGQGFAPTNQPEYVRQKILADHEKRKEAQIALRKSQEFWMGYQLQKGLTHRQAHKQFYFEFGHDIMSVQAFTNYKDTIDMANRINRSIGQAHVEYKENWG